MWLLWLCIFLNLDLMIFVWFHPPMGLETFMVLTKWDNRSKQFLFILMNTIVLIYMCLHLSPKGQNSSFKKKGYKLKVRVVNSPLRVIRSTDTQAFHGDWKQMKIFSILNKGCISKSCFLNWSLNPINCGCEDTRCSAKRTGPLHTGQRAVLLHARLLAKGALQVRCRSFGLEN